MERSSKPLDAGVRRSKAKPRKDEEWPHGSTAQGPHGEAAGAGLRPKHRVGNLGLDFTLRVMGSAQGVET